GLRLRGSHQVDVLRLLRAQRQLALKAAVEGDLDVAQAPRLLPAQFDPGRLRLRKRGGPMMNLDGIAAFVRDVAHEAIEHEGGFGRPSFGRCCRSGLAGKVERVAVGMSLDGLIVAQEGLAESRYLPLI